MAVQAAAGALSLACPCDNIVMCAVPASAGALSQVQALPIPPVGLASLLSLRAELQMKLAMWMCRMAMGLGQWRCRHLCWFCMIRMRPALRCRCRLPRLHLRLASHPRACLRASTSCRPAPGLPCLPLQVPPPHYFTGFAVRAADLSIVCGLAGHQFSKNAGFALHRTCNPSCGNCVPVKTG